jgi:hypothetical protein
MKVLIQDYANERFLADDEWVASPRRALAFHSFADAEEYARQHSIPERTVLSYTTEQEKPSRKLPSIPMSSLSQLPRTGWYP